MKITVFLDFPSCSKVKKRSVPPWSHPLRAESDSALAPEVTSPKHNGFDMNTNGIKHSQ